MFINHQSSLLVNSNVSKLENFNHFHFQWNIIYFISLNDDLMNK